MIVIEKFPVVLFANFRTGSTVLGNYLANKYDLTYFAEPARPAVPHPSLGVHHNGVNLNFYNFYHHSNSNRFLVKFMPQQINALNPYKDLLFGNSFKIKLTRQNKIDQIASLYISKKQKKFAQFVNSSNVNEYSVEIDHSMLISSINTITNQNFMLEHLNITYDYECTYESLGYIPDQVYEKTIYPVNYSEIKDQICNILASSNSSWN